MFITNKYWYQARSVLVFLSSLLKVIVLSCILKWFQLETRFCQFWAWGLAYLALISNQLPLANRRQVNIHLGPVVQKPDNIIHRISHYPAQLTYSPVWCFWRDFCTGQWFLYFSRSFYVRFVQLNRLFLTYFIYWIAAYPVGNAIRPLNNWGLYVLSNSSLL